MTINTKKVTSGPYVGNDIADTFSYTFKINDETQLSVFETDDLGVETLLTLDTDYTVNNIGNSGTVTRNAGALPLNYEWFIRSNYEETQLTAFGSQGPFFPDIHENAMDKLTMLIQQLIDSRGRSPSLADSYRGPLPIVLDSPVAGWGVRWSTDLATLEVFDIDARYANISGDTMDAPLAGPWSENFDDYMPELQITEVIDCRIAASPWIDSDDYKDYGRTDMTIGTFEDFGLVTDTASTLLDYGSI